MSSSRGCMCHDAVWRLHDSLSLSSCLRISIYCFHRLFPAFILMSIYFLPFLFLSFTLSSVDIATGYGLDDRGSIPGSVKIGSRPSQLFSRGKAAGVWSLSLASIWCLINSAQGELYVFSCFACSFTLYFIQLPHFSVEHVAFQYILWGEIICDGVSWSKIILKQPPFRELPTNLAAKKGIHHLLTLTKYNS
jgi:hypothetical protein